MGRRLRVALLVGTIAVLAARPAAAKPLDPTTVAPLTVTAPRPKDLSNFVDGQVHTTIHGLFARWEDPVCPKALGLSTSYDRYFEYRIRDIGKSVGVKVARPKCDPNVLILFTDKPTELLTALTKRESGLFGRHLRRELTDWAQTKSPVVWWHTDLSRPADGSWPSGMGIPVGSGTPDPLGGSDPLKRAVAIGHVEASRLTADIKDDCFQTILVVDANQIRGLRAGAVSAYLAMVSLAEFKMDAARANGPTILDLFRHRNVGRTPAVDLTAWDIAYLKGLYASEASVFGKVQRGQLLAAMERAAAQTAKSSGSAN